MDSALSRLIASLISSATTSKAVSSEVGAFDTPLHLEESQAPSAGDTAFYVVAELLKLAINRLKAESTLDLHDNRARSGC